MSIDKDIKQYSKISRKMEKRFGKKRRRRSGGSYQSLGIVRGFTPTANGVMIQTQHGFLSLSFLAANLLQVRVRPDNQFPHPFSYAISPSFSPEAISMTVSEDTDSILVGGGGMACLVSRAQSHLRIVLPNGKDVSLDVDTGLTWDDEAVRWTRHLPLGERCHALGQRAGRLNLRGKRLALWNHDSVGYKRDQDPVYYSIPFYLGVHPEYALGILWDNPARGEVDLGTTYSDQMSFSSEAGELRFYLIADETAELVLKRYLQLTGSPPLPPLWAFGYHQSRWGYKPSSKFRELATEFRKRQIPCDVLHFDIDYMDGYRTFTFNPKGFGDITSLLKELKQQGFKSVAIVDPAIKADDDYEVYKRGKAEGVFHAYPDGSLYLAPVWAGESAFPDFTKPASRTWWANCIATHIAPVGFDGLWNDMNEPTVFMPKGNAGTIPDFVPADWESLGSTHLKGAHNLYGMQMARATREGFQKTRPNTRPFVLTRAAYAGAQRYTGSWTGDNASTWDHLRLSISMVLNLGLSGMIFTGPDIGGFFGSASGELYARWIQAACLFPFCRTHTAQDTPDQEPWSFGPQVEAIARQYISLRYKLLPYLYSSYVQAVSEGKPLIRPTFFHDPTDSQLYEQDDVFMVGDSLLVAPVTEKGVTSRTFYLPRGAWYDFWTNKLIDGAREVTVEAPLDRLPIFARAGKVIPMWNPVQYIGEKPVDELHLRAYAGAGETAIYEDTGVGLEYQRGEYRYSYFTLGFKPGGQYGIDWRTAGAYEPPYNKARLEIIGIPGEPEKVLVDGQAAALWFFEHGHVEVLSNPFHSVRLVGKARDASAAAKTKVRRPTDDQ